MRLRTLAVNEGIKLGRDRALWITLAGMAGLIAVGVGSAARVAARNPNVQPLSLPTAWPEILGSSGGILVFFTSVAVILLVTSEFRWGTARQHLVAGLSREELYLAAFLVAAFLILRRRDL